MYKSKKITTKTLETIKNIHEAFKNGKIKKLENHEVNPGLPKSSRENYLFFFLSCTINFQRNSPALWKAALNTWNDIETQFVFFPEKIINYEFKDIQAAMLKHKLALQKNKHPLIWTKITKTLYEFYDSDPRNILIEGDYQIAKIIDILQIKNKHLFPFISGIKLSNYSMMILNWYTDAKFSDLYNLSIVPDTHIIKASKLLGIVSENAKPKEVEEAWKPMLKSLNIEPNEMHSALWHWSREGFPTI